MLRTSTLTKIKKRNNLLRASGVRDIIEPKKIYPGKLGYRGLHGKLKPLDCRTNLSSISERGQEMSQECGKNEEKSKKCPVTQNNTFYVAE